MFDMKSTANMTNTLLKVVFLLSFVTAISSEKQVFGQLGKSYSFKPDRAPENIKSILWRSTIKGQGWKVAEWDLGEDVAYYGQTKSRSSLNTSTGIFTIKELEIADGGVYFVEYDGSQLPTSYDLVVIAGAQKPNLSFELSNDKQVSYLKCECEDSSITSFSIWDETDRLSDKREVQVRESSNMDKYYKCKVKNPVSEMESDIIYNRDMFRKASPDANVGAIVGSLVAILMLVLAAVAFWKRQHLKKWFGNEYRDVPRQPPEELVGISQTGTGTSDVKANGDLERSAPAEGPTSNGSTQEESAAAKSSGDGTGDGELEGDVERSAPAEGPTSNDSTQEVTPL